MNLSDDQWEKKKAKKKIVDPMEKAQKQEELEIEQLKKEIEDFKTNEQKRTIMSLN